MLVPIMKAVCSAALGLWGFSPTWCDSCGFMFEEDLAYVELGEFQPLPEFEGSICSGCIEFFD